MNGAFPWSHYSQHPSPGNEHDIENLLRMNQHKFFIAIGKPEWLTFILEFGTNISPAFRLKVGSMGRQCSEEVLIARSVCNRVSIKCKNVSAPPNNLLRSKLALLSNTRFNWEPVTTLNICMCKYSRCDLVFLGNVIDDYNSNVVLGEHSPLTPVHPICSHSSNIKGSSARS